MENAVAISQVMGPVFVILGLSFLLYFKTWIKIMGDWTKNHYTLLPLMLGILVAGIAVVRLYNVWDWSVWLLVTLGGWSMVLKGAFYLLMPGSTIQWALSFRKNTTLLAIGMVAVIVWGLALTYYGFWTTI